MNGDRGGSATAPDRAGRRRALVVYERPRADTAQIAAAIAGALAPAFEVRLAEICDTDPATCGEVDLIVTGADRIAARASGPGAPMAATCASGSPWCRPRPATGTARASTPPAPTA
jgi:hypothetical protein